MTHAQRSFRRQLPRFTLATLALLACTLPAMAQQQNVYPWTRLYTVFPPGGKVGTTVEVTIGGADLEEVAELYFSHPGLKATRVPDPDPKKPGQFVPNKFNVAIAPTVPIGFHDVRAIGKYGISNPRVFAVGDLNEAQEKEPNNDVPQAQKVELNTTISGTINPNVDVDYFAFTGKRGQRVLVSCEASSLDSRLDPLIQLYMPNSSYPIASNRRYHERDAVFDCILPADGEYYVRVVQHAHLAGSAEYYYRLSISVAPWIDVAYPPLIDATKPTTITLLGRNLPNGQPDPKATIDGRPLDRLAVTIPPTGDPALMQRLNYLGGISPSVAALDGSEFRVKNGAGTSNPVLLTYARAPVIMENEGNDAADKAQAVTLPCELCGRIEKLRDRDWYTFTAKANEVFTIEAFAERLGSPLDLYFEIRRVDEKDPKSRPSVGEFDEMITGEILHPTKFNNRTDDPKTRFVVPQDGKYEMMVTTRDADIQAGPRHIYCLSLRKEQPDFRLVLVDQDDNDPTATIVRQGSNHFIHVFCLRQDGFNGDVTVTVEGLPAKVTCPPQTLGPNVKQSALVISAAGDAPPWTGEIKVKGTATIDGKQVTREARSGCVLWAVPQQQNIPTLSRLARSLVLAVREKGPFALDTEVKDVAIPSGGSITTKVKINRLIPEVKVPVQVSTVAAPAPPNAPPPPPQPQVIATIAPDKTDAEVKVAVPNNVAPGVYTLVFRGIAQFPFNKDPKAAQKPNVSIMEATPPIKVTVFNQVADLTVSNPNLMLKAGTDGELIVKVARKHGYTGEFKVSIDLKGLQGVSAQEITIPANANEGKLILKCPANAAPATNPNVIVKATATVATIALTHEAKLGVTVAK